MTIFIETLLLLREAKTQLTKKTHADAANGGAVGEGGQQGEAAGPSAMEGVEHTGAGLNAVPPPPVAPRVAPQYSGFALTKVGTVHSQTCIPRLALGFLSHSQGSQFYDRPA